MNPYSAAYQPYLTNSTPGYALIGTGSRGLLQFRLNKSMPEMIESCKAKNSRIISRSFPARVPFGAWAAPDRAPGPSRPEAWATI